MSQIVRLAIITSKTNNKINYASMQAIIILLIVRIIKLVIKATSQTTTILLIHQLMGTISRMNHKIIIIFQIISMQTDIIWMVLTPTITILINHFIMITQIYKIMLWMAWIANFRIATSFTILCKIINQIYLKLHLNSSVWI